MACDKDLFDKILYDIRNQHKILILMRGLPGSGKSTLAKQLLKLSVRENPENFIYSSDDYFMRNGHYNYNPSLISNAHEWNQTRVKKSLYSGISPIIIDNTNLALWEMSPYCEMAVSHKYIVETLEVTTPWALSVQECTRKNTHRVPKEKIMQMLDKFERNITGTQLLRYLNLENQLNNQSPTLSIQLKAKTTKQKNHKNAKPKESSPKNEIPKNSKNSMQNLISNQSMQKKMCQANDLIDFNENTGNLIDLNSSRKTDRTYYGDNILGVSGNNGTEFWEINSNVLNNSKVGMGQKSPRNGRNTDNGGKLSPAKNQFLNGLYSNTENNWKPINESMNSWLDVKIDSKQEIRSPTTIKCDATTSTRQGASNVDFRDKILIGRNLDINESQSSNARLKTTGFDKGNMVNEEELFEEINDDSQEQVLNNITTMFNGVTKQQLQELLQDFNGNANTMVGTLLDSMSDNGYIHYFSQKENNSDSHNNSENDSDDIECTMKEKSNETSSEKKAIEVKPKKNKHPRKDKTQSISSIQLKKDIEEGIRFSDQKQSFKSKNEFSEEKPSTSQSNMEEDRVVNGNDDKFPRKTSEVSCDEHVIPFKLGNEFIEQLSQVYDLTDVSTEGLEPVINMPESILNQIYALWLESVCFQKERINVQIEKDEEYVRQLVQSEQSHNDPSKRITEFNEIIDMELAFAMTYYPIEELENEDTENLAIKLTRIKLGQMFPEVDSNTLTEVYIAHNHKFTETFQVLLLSTGKITQETADANQSSLPQFLEKLENELVERAKKEREKILNIYQYSENAPYANDAETAADIKKSVDDFRKQAQRHFDNKIKLISKAKSYCRNDRNMRHVVSFYYELAEMEQRRFEQANMFAASRLMQLNITGYNFTTLDLHWFFVTESLEILDVFLDNHITKLNERCSYPGVTFYTTVFVITGRGLHSLDHKPKIKPAVEKRLHERKILYRFLNDGLISVRVSTVNFLSNNYALQKKKVAKLNLPK